MSCHAHSLALSRGFLCLEDVDLIGEGVALLPPDRPVSVVDLGAGSGTTALSVFAARSRSITVTTFDIDPVALDSTEECMSNAGYRLLWQRVQSESWNTADNHLRFAAAEGLSFFDMLLIDASHHEEDVRRDLEAWLPLLRPGAPVWAHDYTWDYPGVIKAIDEAEAAGQLEFIKTAGWGWLGRKVQL